MRPSRLAVLALCASVFALSACGGGDGTRPRLNPPRASVQQLTVLPNGQWRLVLRLQNFSNRATDFTAINGNLSLGGHVAGGVSATPNINIGPESADTVEATVSPSLEAKTAVATALSGGQSVSYRLDGQITTSQRNAPYEFEYESSLNPAPGLPGVLR